MRALATCVCGLFAATGCVSISGPSQAPTAAATQAVTTPRPPATPTAAASVSVSVAPSPTATATASPTATPTLVVPSFVPTDRPPATPSADDGDLLFVDQMEDPASGWALGALGNSSAAYSGGNLRLAIGDSGQAIWSPRLLGAEFGVLLVAGSYMISGGAGAGAACVSPDNQLYGAEITSDGSLIFFSIINGVTQALERHEDLPLELTENQLVGFGIECGATSTGALRLAALMQDAGVLGVYQNDQGPASFSAVSMYAEAIGGSATVDVDEVAAWGIPGSAAGPTPEGEELLTHVPSELQPTCFDTPSTHRPSAVVSCFLQTEGVGAELAIYQQFDTQADMDTAYQQIVDLFGVESEGTCQSGPNETTWSISGETHGRVQCAPQQIGIRFDWTDDQLLILSTLFDLDGDYGNTYSLWAEAGPI